MAAPDYLGEGAGLYEAVQTVALELCPALGICIPVGKDSLSMRTVWEDHGQPKSVTAPYVGHYRSRAGIRRSRET